MGTPILIAVAWPYANAPLHLGHVAGSLLPPDIFARWHRMRGDQVLMVSGSDEHGTPIMVRADEEGVGPAEIADRYHREHTARLADLGISFDLFYRTSDERHKALAQEVFRALAAKGHLVEQSSQGLFCQSCNEYRPDRYVRGTCPRCKDRAARGDQCDACGAVYEVDALLAPRCGSCDSSLQLLPTFHQYLQLQDFQQPLEAFVAAKGPRWRSVARTTAASWLEQGLRPRAVTRDLRWGVEVPLPAYEEKRLYVWFEAVIGYLSATQEWARRTGARSGQTRAWRTWWTNPDATHVYFMGKDNIPFHTIIWPAVLMGYDPELRLPDDIVAAQFLTMDGAKLSKSRGNVVTVAEFLEHFDVDPLRYYLTANGPELKDVDFSWSDFLDHNNNELVATFGNFVHRVLHFAWKNFERVPELRQLSDADRTLLTVLAQAEETIADHLDHCRFRAAMDELMEVARQGNQYIDGQAPWDQVKDNKARAGHTIHVCLKVVRALAFWSAPFMPSSAQRIWRMLGETTALDALPMSAALGKLTEVETLAKPTPLFAKLRKEDFFEADGGWKAAPLQAGAAAGRPAIADDLSSAAVPNVALEAGARAGAPRAGGSAAAAGGSKGLIQIGAMPGSDGGSPGGSGEHTHTEVEKAGEQDDPGADLYLAVGHITRAERHPKAEHLIVLEADFGVGSRQIVAGLVEHYQPAELLGKDAVFLINLRPTRLRGALSQGMILAAEVEDFDELRVEDPDRPESSGASPSAAWEGAKVAILVPEAPVPPGTRVVFSHLGETATPAEVTLTDFVLVPLELEELQGRIVASAGGNRLQTLSGAAIVADRPLPAGSVVR